MPMPHANADAAMPMPLFTNGLFKASLVITIQSTPVNSNHERMTVHHATLDGLSALGGGMTGGRVGWGMGVGRLTGPQAPVNVSVPAWKTSPNIFCGSLQRHLVLDSNCRPDKPLETATPDR